MFKTHFFVKNINIYDTIILEDGDIVNYSCLPADNYVVINKTILNNEDRNTLMTLYQPIIGSIAINLYFTLWSNLDRNNIISTSYNHHYLMSNMRLKLEDIIEAREKLEAIGLICTYFKKGDINEYIYELYSPLEPSEFLNNPILSVTLYNHVGSKEYKKIKEMYKQLELNTKDYKNITLKFTDIFESINTDFIEENDIKKRNLVDIDVDIDLDLNGIFSLIPDEVLNKNSITNELKELIYKLAFIYNYKEEELSKIIRNSIGLKKIVNVDLLKENARKYYTFENKGKLPSIIYKNQPEYLRSPLSNVSSKNKMIYQYETLSPYEFLCMKNDTNKLSKQEVSLLELLLVTYDLKPGVVNVLIDYVLRINDNKLIKNFISTIASQWKKNKIMTVKDAMEQAKLDYKVKKKTVKKEPEWLDKEIKSEKATKEEIEEIERLMNQV